MLRPKKVNCKITNFPLVFFLFVGWLQVQAQDVGLAGRLQHHVSILSSDSLQGRGLGTEGKYKAKAYIADQFRGVGIQAFEGMPDYIQPFETRIGLAWVNAYNIVGYLQGSDPLLKSEYIVIGAHYDHLGYTKRDGEKTIFPGADDNASGVAGIIEIARHFIANPALLKRSLIIIAFDAEESGLLGARHFVDNLPVPAESIRLMFSFDMIGMYEANNGLHLLGIGSLQNGETAAAAVAAANDITLRRTGSGIERRTDTAPFGDRSIPAVHVFTGTKSPYHKPTDTYDLLDYSGMASVVEFSASLLETLSASDTLMPIPGLANQSDQDAGSQSPGITFGLTTHTGAGFHQYENTFFRANSALNFGMGIFTAIPVGRLLTIQPEVIYDMNGSKTDGGNFRRHSLTTPLNLQFGTPRANTGSARAFVFAGPYYRYHLSGKSANQHMDFQDSYMRDEWGYSLGIGIQLFSFQVAFTSRRAATEIRKGGEPKMMDVNNLLSVSVSF